MSDTNVVDARLVTKSTYLPDKIRLIDDRAEVSEEQKNQIVSAGRAKQIANDAGLDLMLISNKSEPHVYKLVDWGKFKYQEDKLEKETRKKQREANKGRKEYWFHIAIEDHDLETKINQIKDHLKDYEVLVGVKADKKNRMLLPRGVNLQEYSKNEDFILKRVIAGLNDNVAKPVDVKHSDNTIFTILKSA